MSKRRRGERFTHYQVPSLRDLARHAVHVASGRPVARTFQHARSIMDTPMTESRSVGTQAGKRQRAAVDGANEVGQGLQVTIPRSVPHLFNNNYTVRLTYADNYRHDVACNGTGGYQQTFRSSSIFDPDLTGTGHQPIMRDLWASQYDYYTVLACEYKLTFFNAAFDSTTYTAVGTSQQQLAAVNLSFMRSTNATDFSNASGTGFAYPQLEMKNVLETHMLVPDEKVVISGTVTPGDFIIDAHDADSDPVWTAVGSNPALLRLIGYIITPCQWAAVVGAGETQYAAIQVQVVLNYTVQFTQLAQSLRSTSS